MGTIRRHLIAGIGLLISAGALYLVVRSIDVGEALGVITTANPAALASIVGIVAAQMVVRSWRWSLLLPRDGHGRKLPIRRLLPPLLIGYLGNAVLPARLGEPMRAVIASRRERIGTTEALGSVLLERAIDVATLSWVAFSAALLAGAPSWATQVLAVAAAAGLVGIVVLVTVGIGPLLRLAVWLGLARRPRLKSVADRFAATVGGASRRPVILASAGVSVGAWLLDAVSFWLAAQAVGVTLSYPEAMLVAGVTVLGTAVPSAPGYVGTFELAAAGVATSLGVPPVPALAMAIVAHVMTLAPMALGGAASLPLVGTSLTSAAREAESIQQSLAATERP